jgi:hypothetical protein
MSEPEPVENPAKAFDRFRDAMKRILTIPKAEIVRREAEAKEQRKEQKQALKKSQ